MLSSAARLGRARDTATGSNTGCNPSLTNCTFSVNSAGAGGGMFNILINSNPTVTNCTFSRNSARGTGGGMWNSSSNSPTVTNCVLWGDTPGEISGKGTPTVAYSNVQGGWPGTGNIDADPMFVDPDNGDYRLSAGSPCIDAGDNIIIDLNGNLRFVDDPDTADAGNGDPPVVDMGAYEFQPVADDDDDDD